ncbi:hypothetical protein DD238_008538 [Peronospora effusa]|uniref:Uncharacterized protein n=1 Tax=Peronospora effusa TaxID=542832 RepID=A0A3M6V6V6_9STRA|nr:hypothetical protein DD238_008538 [Peronospora effusa]
MTTSPSSVVVSGGFSVEVPPGVVALSSPGSPSEDGLKLEFSPASKSLPKCLQVELAVGVGAEPDPNFGRLALALALALGLELELGVG